MERAQWVFTAEEKQPIFLFPLALRFYDLLHSSSGIFFCVNTLTGVVFNRGGLALVGTAGLGLGSEAVSLSGCWHEGIRASGGLPAEDTGMAMLAECPESGLEAAADFLPPHPMSMCLLPEATALASQLGALTMTMS